MAIRSFLAEHIKPFVEDWEDRGIEPSLDIFKKLGSMGILASQIYPGPHLKG